MTINTNVECAIEKGTNPVHYLEFRKTVYKIFKNLVCRARLGALLDLPLNLNMLMDFNGSILNQEDNATAVLVAPSSAEIATACQLLSISSLLEAVVFPETV